MLIGPPLLLAIYFRSMFGGLVHPEALDMAQIGRNLSSGKGFVTYVIRPLSLVHGTNALGQPEVNHGPLFPLILAMAFALRGASDAVSAMVSMVFYLFTIPVLYTFGVRLFGRGVSLLTTLVFVFNALLLEYSTSGLPITLYVFLFTCLFYVLFLYSAYERTEPTERKPKLRVRYLVLLGILTGLLYLTDPIFAWVMPVIIVSVYLIANEKRLSALTIFGIPLLILITPWMARNAMLTGNPVFGLRGWEVWMDTRKYYPGDTAYRHFATDLIPNVGLFKSVVQKILLGAGAVIQAFPQVTASWILAFFLPCLLFRFSDTPTNIVRRVMMCCFFALLVGSLAFKIQMPLFVSLIPVMLLFSVAYLSHLVEQAHLNKTSFVLVTASLAIAVVYPLISDIILPDRILTLKEAVPLRGLGSSVLPDEIVLSDTPTSVAWYADRPSIWLPVKELRIKEIRNQFPTARWIALTENTRLLSREWGQAYDALLRWNVMYADRKPDDTPLESITISGGQTAVIAALDGFTTVPPSRESSLSVVVAAAPQLDKSKLTQSSDSNKVIR